MARAPFPPCILGIDFMESALVKNELSDAKELLREWLTISASMMVVDGRHALPGRKKDLETRTRAAIGAPVPNFT